jgi:hypothetical protein
MSPLDVALFPPTLRPVVLVGLFGLLIVGIGGLLVLLLAMLGGSPTPPPATSTAVTTGSVSDIPADQLPVMQQAAASSSCGLDWSVLAGIARVESGFGSNMATSSAGAIGYGQFLPSSWAAFGQGGDPYDFHDAIPAIARYLCASGAGQDIRQALFAYNHADWYVDQVLGFAHQYANEAKSAVATSPAIGVSVVDLAPGSACATSGVAPAAAASTARDWSWSSTPLSVSGWTTTPSSSGTKPPAFRTPTYSLGTSSSSPRPTSIPRSG